MLRRHLLALIVCALTAGFGAVGQPAVAAMSDGEHACMQEDTAGGCDAGLAAVCSAHCAAGVCISSVAPRFVLAMLAEAPASRAASPMGDCASPPETAPPKL